MRREFRSGFSQASNVNNSSNTGILCSAYGLLEENTDPTREEIAHALSGNLCRCTGYTKIFEAVELAGQALREERSPVEILAERYGTMNMG